MTDQDLLALVRQSLAKVAPETATMEIAADAPLREEYDLDSMDFLNFIIGLHKATGVEIPEIDYPKLGTIAGAVAYLAERRGQT
ncbi:MAG: acyl carrier protein [Acidobacteria bacterium]|nr:acyl carrier protein [Acidobacteriota bacterium]